MKIQVIEKIEEALSKIGASTNVELTPSKGYGDFSTNVAMKLASQLKDSPVNIANKIVAELKADFIEKAEVAGPGFINIFLKSDVIGQSVANIIKKGSDYGRGNQSKYINVEYVSANPTGHLHIGHARGAALGSTLINILKFAGNKVDSEYYINDAGSQIDALGISAFTRYQNELGVKMELPEVSYRGGDVIEVAKELVVLWGDKYKNANYEDVKDIFKSAAKNMLLETIKKHLASYNVHIDIYFSEQGLYDEDKIKPALDFISEHTYKNDGALWLDTTSKGDDKDRVLVKSDGTYTYISPDIAYHKVKLDRGYTDMINVWGADHIGYIKRLSVALEYLGLPQERLDILTVQLVKLMKDGKELKMSKRMGTSFTLQELIEEVGVDAARWFVIDRSNNSGITFDVNEAKKRTSDNPVFTVQYTHARANQLISKSTIESTTGSYSGKEVDLINMLLKFPETVELVANTHKVHLLPQYLLDVTREFNSWYSNSKAIGDPREAELVSLAKATKIVIANGLKLLGINAPDRMD